MPPARLIIAASHSRTAATAGAAATAHDSLRVATAPPLPRAAEVPLKIPVDTEPTFVALGPSHVAVVRRSAARAPPPRGAAAPRATWRSAPHATWRSRTPCHVAQPHPVPRGAAAPRATWRSRTPCHVAQRTFATWRSRTPCHVAQPPRDVPRGTMVPRCMSSVAAAEFACRDTWCRFARAGESATAVSCLLFVFLFFCLLACLFAEGDEQPVLVPLRARRVRAACRIAETGREGA